MLKESIESVGSLKVIEIIRDNKNFTDKINVEIAMQLPIHPISDEALRIRMALENTIKRIPNIRQKKLVLMPPELMLMEVISKILPNIEIEILLDKSIEDEVTERIGTNIPANQKTKLCQVPNIPNNISSNHAVVIAVGFNGGGGYALIQNTTRNILQYYKEFYFGEIILIDPVGSPIQNRPEGWVTVNKSQLFTQHITPKASRQRLIQLNTG